MTESRLAMTRPGTSFACEMTGTTSGVTSIRPAQICTGSTVRSFGRAFLLLECLEHGFRIGPRIEDAVALEGAGPIEGTDAISKSRASSGRSSLPARPRPGPFSPRENRGRMSRCPARADAGCTRGGDRVAAVEAVCDRRKSPLRLRRPGRPRPSGPEHGVAHL